MPISFYDKIMTEFCFHAGTGPFNLYAVPGSTASFTNLSGGNQVDALLMAFIIVINFRFLALIIFAYFARKC